MKGLPFHWLPAYTVSLTYTVHSEAQRALHKALLSAALLMSWPELSFQGPRQGCVDRFPERSFLLVCYRPLAPLPVSSTRTQVRMGDAMWW